MQLSQHFTCRRLLRYCLPSIIMMVFTSVYGVVDGFFVSNFAGKTPFAAVNFIMPILMILGCAGFMFGTGGSALIGMALGEGDNKKANNIFSLVVYSSIVCGVLLAIIGLVILRPVATLMGAENEMLRQCLIYGGIFLAGLPFYILQYEFQCLFATADKHKLGMYVTIIAGCTNIVLDALFVAVFPWGVAGAAVATVISQIAGGIIPLVYFLRKNDSPLRLTKCSFDGTALLKTCTNGSSELMSNISASVVGMLFNVQLMKYAGENGVAAYGVLMYVSWIFQAIFLGYTVGTAPVVSYHYGADNKDEVKNLLKKSLIIVAAVAVCMYIAGELLSWPLSKIFVGYDAELMDMTVNAFYIFSFSFLFFGFSVFGSSFFTALGDGLTSAAIAFLRTLVFQIAAVMLLPLIFGLNGIWASIVAAEIVSVAVMAVFFAIKRKKYGY
ncbi:MAG TPA: MATE family efflux transporter [Firmicutes bacterium]|nr:MATE family efflux transporter [Bacillota bacterium]